MPVFSVVSLAKYIESSGKERALNRGYQYFMEGYVHDVWFAETKDMSYVKA